MPAARDKETVSIRVLNEELRAIYDTQERARKNGQKKPTQDDIVRSWRLAFEAKGKETFAPWPPEAIALTKRLREFVTLAKTDPAYGHMLDLLATFLRMSREEFVEGLNAIHLRSLNRLT